MIFEGTIKETLTRVIEVEAGTVREAKAKLMNRYTNQEEILDWSDLSDTTFLIEGKEVFE